MNWRRIISTAAGAAGTVLMIELLAGLLGHWMWSAVDVAAISIGTGAILTWLWEHEKQPKWLALLGFAIATAGLLLFLFNYP